MRQSRFLLVLGALTLSHTAVAQVPLVDGLGGMRGFGEQCLGPNDDQSSTPVDLSPVFPQGIRFFGQTLRSMYVNTNGNVTFDGQRSTYSPEAFPQPGRPMIAPYWADVDIRTTCDDGSDGNTGTAPRCHNPASNGVWWDMDAAARRVTVTWDQVGYYQCRRDKRMSFQMVLTPASQTSCGAAGDFDVEFRYNRCEWNTGDQSGGVNGLSNPGGTQSGICVLGRCTAGGAACSGSTGSACTGTVMSIPAQAGFDPGNTVDWVEIPGSRTGEIHNILCQQSNVGQPGIWRFQVREGAVVCPDAGGVCDTGMLGACGVGRTRCVRGTTECAADVTATTERCDAIDNDCDGTADEGENLCQGGAQCVRGTCVAVCFEGSCAAGLSCDNATGQCVDAACVGVECAPGQRCSGGSCVDGCAGVVCPGEQSCRAGRCIDACAGNECDDCTACEAATGRCIARCSADSCGAGLACNAAGVCVEQGCEALTCDSGLVCRGGQCVDACQGAVCPSGEACEAGLCVPSSEPGAPTMDGGTYVPPTTPDGSASLPDAAVPDEPADRQIPGRADSGCGCRTSSVSDLPFAVLMLVALSRVRRRRRVN